MWWLSSFIELRKNAQPPLFPLKGTMEYYVHHSGTPTSSCPLIVATDWKKSSATIFFRTDYG